MPDIDLIVPPIVAGCSRLNYASLLSQVTTIVPLWVACRQEIATGTSFLDLNYKFQNNIEEKLS